MILKNIEKLCKEKNISISKLERECGIGNGTIGRWNESEPGIRKVQKVADYLGVSIEELLR